MSEVDKTRSPGRPPQLSNQLILEAVAASENIDSLTMRELAARLGVRHGALYRWVAGRDALFDLVGESVVERILAGVQPAADGWQEHLRTLLRGMHDEFLAFPGYATHLSRPHPHNPHSTRRLHDAVVAILLEAGLDDGAAEQGWYVVITSVVGWLAFREQQHHLSRGEPRFEVLLDVLVGGLQSRVGT